MIFINVNAKVGKARKSEVMDDLGYVYETREETGCWNFVGNLVSPYQTP